MRRAFLSLGLLLLAAASAFPATYAQRMEATRVSRQNAIRYYTDQDNYCRREWARSGCKETEMRLSFLKVSIESFVIADVNAAQRAYNRYFKSRTKKNADLLDAALAQANADLELLKIP